MGFVRRAPWVGVAVALGLAAAVTVTTSACGGVEAASPAAGRRATDFTARDIDGNTVRLSDYLGKQTVLLDFGTSWSRPSLAQLPHVRGLYAEHKDHGLVVLAIAMDSPDTVADVPAWARRNNIVFPVLLDQDSHIASIYNPKKTAPFAVLIDKSADIVFVQDGYNTGYEVPLRKAVESALDAR